MELIRLRCQICLTMCNSVRSLRSHLSMHKKQMKELFENDAFEAKGILPYIVFMDQKRQSIFPKDLLGLFHLTMAFSPGVKSCVYLCHVCQQNCPAYMIVRHVQSADHVNNYLSNTEPDLVEFSWTPKQNSSELPVKARDARKTDTLPYFIWVLHLPSDLLLKTESQTYSEVMTTFSENPKLFKHLQDALPKTVTIQQYQKDVCRKNPLLGMPHLVECVCVGPSHKNYFLCTLCRLTVAPRMVIKHVLSFDHLHRYFEEWHPNTLLSKASYSHSASLSSLMLDFSIQALDIQASSSPDIRQLILGPAEFTSVNFRSYTEALGKLQLIKKCSLEISITQGQKLVPHSSAAAKSASMKVQSAPTSAAAAAAPPPPAAAAAKYATSSTKISSVCKLYCQNCDLYFNQMFQYCKHVGSHQHKMILAQHFSDAPTYTSFETRASFHLGLYSYIQECLKKNEPVIGIPMVMSCISSEIWMEALILCFACRELFSDSMLQKHFTSQKHLLHTLFQYQDLDLLPFAWEPQHLDCMMLRTKVWEEERATGPFAMALKVFDLPYCSFWRIMEESFDKAMSDLRDHPSFQINRLPQLKTQQQIGLKSNFPQLGKNFLVMYDVEGANYRCTQKAFLCLLCMRKLEREETFVHIVSQEHVARFLDGFHPGSLDSGHATAETFLDLAQQAAKLHPEEAVQVIHSESPVWQRKSYTNTKSFLRNCRKTDWIQLVEPPITPQRKLEKGGNGETPAPESEVKEEVLSGSADETVKPSEALPTIKDERKESESETSGDVPKSCQSRDEEDRTRSPAEERQKVEHDIQLETSREEGRGNKRTIGMREEPQEGKGPGEDEETVLPRKRQRTKSEVELCCEETTMQNIDLKKESSDAAEEISMATDKGLGALYDCRFDRHESIYLCEHCSLKIPQKQFLSHVTQPGHANVQLKVVNLDQEVYSLVSRKNFNAVINTVKACLARPEPSSLSALRPVKEEVTQCQTVDLPDVYIVEDNIKVEELKSEYDGSYMDFSPSLPTVPPSQVTPEKKGTDTNSEFKASESARETNSARFPPDLSGKLSGVAPHSAVESLKTEGAVRFDVKTPVKSVYAAVFPERAAASSQRTESAASGTIGKTDPEWAPTTQAETRAASASGAVRCQTGAVATGKAAENAPEYSHAAPAKSVKCQTPVTSMAAVKHLTPAAVKKENPDACVKAATANADAATRQIPAVPPVMPEFRKPPKELQLLPANRLKTPEGFMKIGSDQLIILTCMNAKRRKVYCQVCSVMLRSTDHLREVLNHQYNYVQWKYPGWTAEPSEFAQKFQLVVADLAKREKEQGDRSRMLPVPLDDYEMLNRLPVKEAIQKINEMLEIRDPQDSSLSKVSKAAALLGSPCEVTSSDDGVGGGNPWSSARPEVRDPDSVFARTLGAHGNQEPPGCSQAPARRSSKPQDPRMLPRTAPKAPGVKVPGPNQRVELAAGDRNKLRVSRRSPRKKVSPDVLLMGQRIEEPSDLSKFLSVANTENEPILGLGRVWECRSSPNTTLFLCESCELTLRLTTVCKHMISQEHQENYLKYQPEFWTEFGSVDDLTPDEKEDILKEVATKVSVRDRSQNIDAKVVVMGQNLYNHLQMVPFSEAVEILEFISENRQKAAWPLASRLPEESQRLESQPRLESPSAEVRPSSGENDLGSGKEADALEDVCSRLSVPPAPQQDPVSVPQVQEIKAEPGSPSSAPVCPEVPRTRSVCPADKLPPDRTRSADSSAEAQLESCYPLPAKSTPAPLELSSASTSESQCVNPNLSPEQRLCYAALSHILQNLRGGSKVTTSSSMCPPGVDKTITLSSLQSEKTSVSVTSQSHAESNESRSQRVETLPSNNTSEPSYPGNELLAANSLETEVSVSVTESTLTAAEPQQALASQLRSTGSTTSEAETDRTELSPINTIVTDGGKYAKLQFSGSSKGPHQQAAAPPVDPPVTAPAKPFVSTFAGSCTPNVSHPAVGLNPSQFYQGVNYVSLQPNGWSSVADGSQVWSNTEMQQQYLRYQYLLQQYQQQQHYQQEHEQQEEYPDCSLSAGQ